MKEILAALALSAVACQALEPEEIKQCEAYLQAKLKSPASYKRVEASSFSAPKEGGSGNEWIVIIKYDAANSYNAMIRDTQICYYPIRNGKADLSISVDHDGILQNRAEAIEDRILNGNGE